MQSKIQAVLQMFEAIETGNVRDAEAYIASDYLNRESADDGRSDQRGPAEFRETTQWLRSTFSDLRFENTDVFGCEDRVVVVTYMHGRHVSEFFGIPATDRMFRQRQVHLFRVDHDNKVSEHLAQRDDLGLRRLLTQGS
jgi:predicted ester cyclase